MEGTPFARVSNSEKNIIESFRKLVDIKTPVYNEISRYELLFTDSTNWFLNINGTVCLGVQHQTTQIPPFLIVMNPFQINTVVKTDRDLGQWLDLGNQSQACITIPETCGSQGGTISAWIKPIESNQKGGIIIKDRQASVLTTTIKYGRRRVSNSLVTERGDLNINYSFLCRLRENKQ